MARDYEILMKTSSQFTEWKLTSSRSMLDLQTNKTKTSRDEILKSLREKAQNIFKEVRLTVST